MINFQHPAVQMRRYFVNKYGLNEMISLEKTYLNKIGRSYKKDPDSGFRLWSNAYNRQCEIAVSIITEYEQSDQRERHRECDT